MQYRYERDSSRSTKTVEIGTTFFRDRPDQKWEYRGDYYRLIDDAWFTGHPRDVLARIGITCETRRAEDFADLIEGDLSGFSYAAAACPDGSDEGIKWIMGGLAQELKERGVSFDKAHSILPAPLLGAFVQAVVDGQIDRTVSKDIFAALLKEPLFETRFGTEHVIEGSIYARDGKAVWRHGRAPDRPILVEDIAKALEDGADIKALQCSFGENLTPDIAQHIWAYSIARDEMGWEQAVMREPVGIVGALIDDPRFALADTSVIDDLVDQVIQANPDKAEAAKAKPQLAQWFVGQVLKAAKDQKLSAPDVLAKLKTKLGVS